LCAQQQLWGKAQSYLEASLSVEATYAAHFELAQLHERLGRADDARVHYRASLDLAVGRIKRDRGKR
jgi:HemY protein